MGAFTCGDENPAMKKALFYSILSIMFVSLAVFAFMYQSAGNKFRDEMHTVETRIYAMNDFVKDIEGDLDRVVHITGFRALSAIVDEVITSGNYVNNVGPAFEEAFVNGTIGNKSALLMNESTFNDWLSRIQNISNELGISVDVELKDLTIEHASPWLLNVSTNISFFAVDLKETANWTRNISIVKQIDIRGFEDPLYVLNSYGRATNLVNQTIHGGNYTSGSGPTFDPGNLEQHANNSLYAENANAPSYLMRLEGDLGPSPYGIESMVNLEKLGEQGLDVEEKSVIDYIYFSGNNPASLHVNKMPDWFMIDNARTDKYQVTGETY
jgi:hypothetical protein